MGARTQHYVIPIAAAIAAATLLAPTAAVGVVAKNAEKVDGFSAVSSSASLSSRAGKLVATDGKGMLPDRIVGTAKDADRLAGRTLAQVVAAGRGDLTCAGCVAMSELGFDPTTAAELSAFVPDDLECPGCVSVTDLAFDPATQGELDALVPDDLECLGCVGGGEILDGSVGADDLAGGAVGADALAPGAVGSLEAGPTDDDAIADGSVDAQDLADGEVGQAEIATDGVGAAEIVAGAVGTSEIATAAVDSDEIAAAAVGTSELANGGVASPDLAAVDGSLRGQMTIDVGNVPGDSCADFSRTVTGLVNTDFVILNPAATLPINLQPAVLQPETNTLNFRICNKSASAINPDGGPWNYLVIR